MIHSYILLSDIINYWWDSICIWKQRILKASTILLEITSLSDIRIIYLILELSCKTKSTTLVLSLKTLPCVGSGLLLTVAFGYLCLRVKTLSRLWRKGISRLSRGCSSVRTVLPLSLPSIWSSSSEHLVRPSTEVECYHWATPMSKATIWHWMLPLGQCVALLVFYARAHTKLTQPATSCPCHI